MRLITYLIAIAIVAGIVRDNINWDQAAAPFRLARLYTEPADATLHMPVLGVRARSISNTWHAGRSRGRKHEGQDIFARKGTPVVAATDGIVVRLGGGELGGNAVFVAGRGARTFYYAHLDRYAEGVVPGTLVNSGEILGYVGNTGNARTTPPHLHFAVYSPTGPIDPLPLLRLEKTLNHPSGAQQKQS